MPREVVLTLPPSAEEPSLDAAALRTLLGRAGVPAGVLGEARVRRVSFDARRRERCWRIVVDVWAPGEPVPPSPRTTPAVLVPPAPGAPHVVVVGSGPAGLCCALDALAAGLRVTVVERGRDVQTRRHALAAANRGQAIDPDSNYCFGEGGAGTYSDGKLYARAGRRDAVRGVLELLVAHGAPLDVLTSWRPHIGSNRLPRVVAALRESIRSGGGRVRFATRAVALVVEDGRVAGVVVRDVDEGATETLPAAAVVLATGHSAPDALAMLRRAGAPLAAKGFALGVRIEHPQPWLDQRQYGGLRDACALPAAFYELTAQVDARGVYSFCMCPGGFIVPASTASSRVVVNGMSLRRRDSPFANSGLVVQLEPADWCGDAGRALGLDLVAGPLPEHPDADPLFGVRLQEGLETRAAQAGGGGNRAPVQRADAFVEGRGATPAPLATSYRPGLVATDLATVLPPGIVARLRVAMRTFDARLPGFAGAEGQLVGVETRTSSPVRVLRDPETLESPGVAGLHPAGEGAGWAGGIVSAALDGRRVARALARRLLG
ncbi:MAG: FAD-dependent oxidoreductase [bacterium]|nr:FAD-dependent oxidoreductase [bacterium]